MERADFAEASRHGDASTTDFNGDPAVIGVVTIADDAVADALIYVAYIDGLPYAVEMDGDTVRVRMPNSDVAPCWQRQDQDGAVVLQRRYIELDPTLDPDADAYAVAELAALEALWASTTPSMRTVCIATENSHAAIHPDMFWQQTSNWLSRPRQPLPLRYCMSEGRRHPLRPAKPEGTVYRRYIPWLRQTLSLRAFDDEQDLPRLNRWMNDPDVAHFWQEQGDLEHHRCYLAKLAADPHVFPLIACLNGQPFAYFEIYWAREDRIAPFSDAADYDRGWHVLVGEPQYRGRDFVSAWMPSISHYLLLDDPRTQRLLIEPRADNRKMLRSLQRSGYALLKEFDFPHKRAMLGMLSRERFFSEQLWIPGAASSTDHGPQHANT